MNESRELNMTIVNKGGSSASTASKNAVGYRMNLPSKWVTEMGIHKDDKKVTLSFDGKKITIEKNNEVF